MSMMHRQLASQKRSRNRRHKRLESTRGSIIGSAKIHEDIWEKAQQRKHDNNRHDKPAGVPGGPIPKAGAKVPPNHHPHHHHHPDYWYGNSMSVEEMKKRNMHEYFHLQEMTQRQKEGFDMTPDQVREAFAKNKVTKASPKLRSIAERYRPAASDAYNNNVTELYMEQALKESRERYPDLHKVLERNNDGHMPATLPEKTDNEVQEQFE